MATHQNSGTGVMNRRNFVRSAALLAAGSTLAGPLLGCSDNIILDIPCLGPADPPVPVAGMTYIKASEIGCALDCKLETGLNKFTGEAATDDAPRINAAMAGASAANPITLIIDGSALISGLFLPAGGYWSIAGLGCGTGFFIKTGTNNDGIHNGPPDADVPTDHGPPVPPRGMNVSLSNFTVNGNQGNGYNGDSTTGTRQGTGYTWFFPIDLINLDNITIENVVVINSPTFHFRFSNVGNVTISGCVMASTGVNTDGLHFDGPANDIAISNCTFTTDDDSIALNCPEGYGGDISRVTITNCKFNSFSLLRLYTADLQSHPGKYYIDTVSVSNCTGTLAEVGFMIGISGNSNPNSITGLTISDCDLTAPAILGIAENFGTIALSNVNFTPSLSNVWWEPRQLDHVAAFVRSSLPYPDVTYLGSSLSFTNCSMTASRNMKVAAVILEDQSSISILEFNGFAVKGGLSSSQVPVLCNLEPGTIEQLIISALDTAGSQALLSPGQFSSIGSVSGAGVLATGWQFPDSVMANSVPYISATSHSPSIKVAGIVKSYP